MGRKAGKLPGKLIIRKPWIRPLQYKIIDKDTLERILNPPPKPPPGFQGQEYVAGINPETKYLFACTEPNCTAKFISQLSLSIHIRKHVDRNIRCSFCHLLMKNNQELSLHKTAFHPDLDKYPEANPLQCQKCLKVSRNVRALWRHVRESHRDTTYPCPHCEFPFTRPENLKEHVKAKHADVLDQPLQTFYCQYCPRSFRYKNSLRTHVRRAHRVQEKTYRCVLCDTIYTNLQAYQTHIRRHCQPRYISCQICKGNYGSYSHLRRHFESYVHKKAARNQGNGDSDIEIPKIVTVKSAVNPNLTPAQLIELCKKTNVRVSLHRVDEHIAHQSICKISKFKPVSTNGTNGNASKSECPYFCMYCNGRFSDISRITAHEKICLMNLRCKKLHFCQVCGKEFDTPCNLRAHSRTHTSERSYPCSFCPEMFKTPLTKANHEKVVHFGILPKSYYYSGKFPCKEPGCDKVFRRPEGVRKHTLAVHIGTRFTCEICGRSYREKMNYRQHLKNDHAECPLRFECKPCQRTYKNKATYVYHLARKRHARKVKEAKKKHN